MANFHGKGPLWKVSWQYVKVGSPPGRLLLSSPKYLLQSPKSQILLKKCSEELPKYLPFIVTLKTVQVLPPTQNEFNSRSPQSNTYHSLKHSQNQLLSTKLAPFCSLEIPFQHFSFKKIPKSLTSGQN